MVEHKTLLLCLISPLRKHIRMCPDHVKRGKSQIVTLGNKFDVEKYKINAGPATFKKKLDAAYYGISVKANFQTEKPISYLMRANVGPCFVVMPFFKQTEMSIDIEKFI